MSIWPGVGQFMLPTPPSARGTRVTRGRWFERSQTKHNSELRNQRIRFILNSLSCCLPILLPLTAKPVCTEDMVGQLIHPELSYEVRGVLLHVYNTLGPMLKEEYYEQAIAVGLDKRQIRCETQKTFEVYYEDERV